MYVLCYKYMYSVVKVIFVPNTIYQFLMILLKGFWPVTLYQRSNNEIEIENTTLHIISLGTPRNDNGTSLRFQSTSYIEIPVHAENHPIQSFTVAGWVSFDHSEEMTVLQVQDENRNSVQMSLGIIDGRTKGTVQTVTNSTTSPLALLIDSEVSSEKWLYFILSVDMQNTLVTLYLRNDTKQADTNTGVLSGFNFGHITEIRLGGIGVEMNPFEGEMTCVIVFDYALNISQANELLEFVHEKCPYHTTYIDRQNIAPLAFWPMDRYYLGKDIATHSLHLTLTRIHTAKVFDDDEEETLSFDRSGASGTVFLEPAYQIRSFTLFMNIYPLTTLDLRPLFLIHRDQGDPLRVKIRDNNGQLELLASIPKDSSIGNDVETVTAQNQSSSWKTVGISYDATNRVLQIHLDGTYQLFEQVGHLNITSSATSLAFGEAMGSKTYLGQMTCTLFFDKSMSVSDFNEIVLTMAGPCPLDRMESSFVLPDGKLTFILHS